MTQQLQTSPTPINPGVSPGSRADTRAALNRRSWAGVATLLAMTSCSPGSPSSPSEPAPRQPSDTAVAAAAQASGQTSGQAAALTLAPPVVLPQAQEHHPSYIKMAARERFDAQVFAQVDTCAQAGCHAQIVQEWRQSMHAFASLNNPIYRVSFEDFQRDTGPDKTKFCGGCHDVALMFDGAISAPQIKPEQDAAHVGLTCNACHGVVQADVLGNASSTLTTSPIPIPSPGDALSLAQHKARVAPDALRADALCVSCHRGFLTPASGHAAPLEGLVEWPQWRGSAYHGVHLERVDPDVQPQRCVSCHMPRSPEGHASHRFPGGHTTFAAMIGAPEQLKAQVELLRGAATLDLMPVMPGPSPQAPDDVLTLRQGVLEADVILFNERVGHTFPGGARDLRDTWLEVELLDAQGRVWASTGSSHAQDAQDHEAHRLYLHQASALAQAQTEHNVSHFRTPVFDATVRPRDAQVVRVRWEPAPERQQPQGPLKLRATLRHRHVSLSMMSRVCQERKTARGASFAARTQALHGVAPDPCVTPPIIELAQITRALDQPASAAPDDRALWLRHYRHALGLAHQVQERLEEAAQALELAQQRLAADASKPQRAMILVAQAQILGRQGRTQEALARFDQAQPLIPGHPAIAYGQAMAAMQVWRFDEAIAALEPIAQLVNDDRVWRQLAIAYGSVDRPQDSLRAAHKGLALEPRDADLLRAQFLAYQQLGAPPTWLQIASAAFDTFERDPEAPGIRSRCSADAAWCRRERTPVHVHVLRPR